MQAKTPSAKRPVPPVRRKKKKRRAPEAGPFGLAIPVAGGMIGLSRSGSYRAAKSGLIPTVGHIVPRLIWEKMLGIQTVVENTPTATPRALSGRKAYAPELEEAVEES